MKNIHLPTPAERRVRAMQAAKLRRYLREVVLPFNEHYRRVFAERGLKPRDLRTLEDLRHLPFTEKEDLIENPRAFVIIPDKKILSRRPGNILRALVLGRKKVARELEREYRPIFVTSTTGRSSDPVPFTYSAHDLDRLADTGERMFEVCGAEREMKILNMFPFAPHRRFLEARNLGCSPSPAAAAR